MDELDRLKANLSAGSSQGRSSRGGSAPAASTGTVSFSIQTTRAHLPAVLDLLRQVLREPTLPEEEFEILKRERLVGLDKVQTEPSALAPRTLTHLLSTYPKDDVRYVPTIEEEIERVQGPSKKTSDESVALCAAQRSEQTQRFHVGSASCHVERSRDISEQ